MDPHRWTMGDALTTIMARLSTLEQKYDDLVVTVRDLAVRLDRAERELHASQAESAFEREGVTVYPGVSDD